MENAEIKVDALKNNLNKRGNRIYNVKLKYFSIIYGQLM